VMEAPQKLSSAVSNIVLLMVDTRSGLNGKSAVRVAEAEPKAGAETAQTLNLITVVLNVTFSARIRKPGDVKPKHVLDSPNSDLGVNAPRVAQVVSRSEGEHVSDPDQRE